MSLVTLIFHLRYQDFFTNMEACTPSTRKWLFTVIARGLYFPYDLRSPENPTYDFLRLDDDVTSECQQQQCGMMLMLS